MSNVQQKGSTRKKAASRCGTNGLKPLRELPGFREAFAELLDDEARQGWWCDYGFPIGDIGDVVIPQIGRISSFRVLQRFAMAIKHTLPPVTGCGHIHLLPPTHPPAANDCEAVHV